MMAGQYCCLLDLLIYYLVRSDVNFNARVEGGAYKLFLLIEDLCALGNALYVSSFLLVFSGERGGGGV